MTEEEREALWEKLYGNRGFGMWQGNFRDILVDRTANAMVSDFVARKIRQRVKDQAVAEKLIPKNHGFGTRRVPLETKYYEVYNQPNVKLVDIKETPIERITPDGIKTSDAEYAFDIIIYATGFDAITGAFDRIDFQGVDGLKLKDKWKGGPQTYLGIMVEGFPNMMMQMGPHTALGNIPRSIEYSVEWVTDLLGHAQEHDITRIEATPEGVHSWTDHVKSLGVGPVVQRDRFLDDRHQPQRRGQDHPHHRPLQRQRPGVPRTLRLRWRPTATGSSDWHNQLASGEDHGNRHHRGEVPRRFRRPAEGPVRRRRTGQDQGPGGPRSDLQGAARPADHRDARPDRARWHASA